MENEIILYRWYDIENQKIWMDKGKGFVIWTYDGERTWTPKVYGKQLDYPYWEGKRIEENSPQEVADILNKYLGFKIKFSTEFEWKGKDLDSIELIERLI